MVYIILIAVQIWYLAFYKKNISNYTVKGNYKNLWTMNFLRAFEL